MPVYVLLGLPGSGVLEISRNLVNFSPDGVELSVVVASDSGAGAAGLVYFFDDRAADPSYAPTTGQPARRRNLRRGPGSS